MALADPLSCLLHEGMCIEDMKLKRGLFRSWQLQSTLDNLNLQGKSKTVRVIGSWKQITRSEEMG